MGYDYMDTVSFFDVISQVLEAFFGMFRLAFYLVWNGEGAPFVFNFVALSFWRVFFIGSVVFIIGRLILRRYF